MTTTPATTLRSEQPARPSEDLAAWSAILRGASDGSVLSSEMIAFCTSGLSVVMAARGSNGRPIAGLALAARADAGVLRLMLRRPANVALLDAIAQGSAVAATFTRPRDHSAVQLKGRAGSATPADAEDMAALATQTAQFREVLIGMGYSPAFSALYGTYQVQEIVTVPLMTERAFVQTPGPGAGSEIRP
ncbi:hypothetical protein HMH01_14615 [Halovulum dunhuangense]|uniref:Pyridoxamine 5'-phosphate oxidase n=1 Tax=Halovulum dunhuangense TaxID=1505036 RepID=A0A849L6B4_9RHOB|nr:hypothetical protein [Halovulum dunhuangense]NNU81670.1 hypothetical protein [Halovulum dunhuangense]